MKSTTYCHVPEMKAMDNYKQKAIVSLFSSYASQFATTATTLTTKLLLARLIAPKDFGTYALALLVLLACDLFIDFGISQHLTREKHRPYGNVLLMRLTTATFLFLLIQSFAHKMTFWGANLPHVLRVLSIVMLFKAVSWVPTVYIDRELLIHRSLLPQFSRLLLTAGVSIYLGFLHWGVWALVYGTIAGEAAFAVTIWRAAWGHIPIELTWRHTWEMVRGSKFLFLIALMGFGLGQGDIAIIGTVLDSKQVGYYTMAYSLVIMVSRIIETSIYRVIYPMFCEYKDRTEDLGRIYRQATLAITAIEAPIYFFLLFNAPTVVAVLLSKKWMPTAIIMQALSVSGIINPFSTFGNELLRARGMDRLLIVSTIISSTTFVGCGYLLTRAYGTMGMVAANYIIIGSIPTIIRVYKTVKPDFKKLAGELGIVYVTSFASIALVSVLLRKYPHIEAIVASLLIPICWYTYYRAFGDNFGSKSINMIMSRRSSTNPEVSLQSD